MSERADFEKFLTNKGYALNYAGDGQYQYSSTQLNWELWQAATKQSEARIKDFEKQALRYEFVRKLTPAEFAEIYAINIKTGIHFDDLIDQEILEIL